MKNQTQIKKQMIFSIIGISQFFIISVLCMFLYSGGTSENFSSQGYDFFNNVFSDLGRTIAFNGDSNLLSCIIYNSSLIFMAVSSIPFSFGLYHILETPNKKNSIEKIALICGIISGVFFVGVGFTPYDIIGYVHGAMLRFGFLSGLLMFLFITISILNTKHLPKIYAIFSVICIISQILYIMVMFDVFPFSETAEVTIQKIVVYILFSTYLALSIGGYKLIKMEEYMRS